MSDRKASTTMNLIPDYGDLSDPEIRTRYGYLEAGVSILCNIMLFSIKLIFGIFINSIALITDAFHTLSDVGTSLVVIFGFRASKKPADEEHPFGHGKSEYVAALIIAVLLVIVGMEFAWQSIDRIMTPIAIEHQEIAPYIGVIVIISAALKEATARYSIAIGRRIDSEALIADAWHHRSDALTSVAVGISVIGSGYGYPILDPLSGAVVSAVIIYTGIDLIRRSSDYLMGLSPGMDVLANIMDAARSVRGVYGIHKINVHDYGTTKVVSLHVEVDGRISLEEAHRIADAIEREIMSKTRFQSTVHTDPIDVGRREI
jgi:cation diffusion facilitator family transporter